MTKKCLTCSAPVNTWPTIFRGDRTCSVVCEKALEIKEHPGKFDGRIRAGEITGSKIAAGTIKATDLFPRAPSPQEQGREGLSLPAPLYCPGCNEEIPTPIPAEKTDGFVMYKNRLWHRVCGVNDGGHQ